MMSPEEREVNKKHNCRILYTSAITIAMMDKQDDTNLVSQFLVSSTKHSQVLMVMHDYRAELPHHSSLRFSEDENNPWLVRGYVDGLNFEFRTKLKKYWKDEAKVPAEWAIRPFRMYEWNENASKWEERKLEVDRDNKVVRVTIKDQTFWCHPPRLFEVLENACNKKSNKRFKQIDGNLGKALKDFQNVDTDEKIPKDRKPETKNKFKTSIEKAVDDLYQLVEDLQWDDDSKLTSYRYPTLQMGADKDYNQPGNATSQRSQNMNRFGAESSGVYRADDNEVHFRFEREGTEPVPKPTKEEFRKWVLNSGNRGYYYNRSE
jgi:hypothetical protein